MVRLKRMVLVPLIVKAEEFVIVPFEPAVATVRPAVPRKLLQLHGYEVRQARA